MQRGTLIFFAGKMGAGKSTRSKQIAKQRQGVLISEDTWLEALYPQKITNFDEYLHYAALLRPIMRQHVIALLLAGVDVVMDYPANTMKQRLWFKALIEEARAAHLLIYLHVSDRVCLQRIAQRRSEHPQRENFDTEAVFRQVTHYFEEPTSQEGFRLQVEE